MINILPKKISLVAVGLAFTVSAFANTVKPIEIKTFTQVREHVKDKDTLLLISIDNTLLKSSYQMGQRSWFYHRKDKHLKSGMKGATAAQKAVAEWTGVLNLFGQQPVANDIAKTIEEIQKNEVRIIGVSSRGLGLASITIQHLAQAGIDLGRTSGLKKDIPMVLGEKLLLYRDGVLFTSGVGKAIALKKLSDLVNISRPKKIVMVSHDARTLNLVAEGIKLHGQGIEFMPLRYTAMDQESKAFNAQVADVQFESLMSVLSNAQAKAKVQKARPATQVLKK